MFIDLANVSLLAAQHERDLRADADSFRLAKLARAARRRAARPEPPPPDPVRSRRNPAPRNDDADRRYAVSR